MTAAPPGGQGPGASPGFLLWHATMRWQRDIVAALRPLALTHVQFVLLASVWWLCEEAGEQPSQRRLAEQAGTDAMMTSQVLRTLESRGLVRRDADPGDARARRLSVTPDGAHLARRAIEIVETADAAFFAPAGSDRLDAVALLQRLARRPAS